ncbi:MAG: hypothetical protein ACMG6E_02380 [Candidatus Roizmanbacteria bacterium]
MDKQRIVLGIVLVVIIIIIIAVVIAPSRKKKKVAKSATPLSNKPTPLPSPPSLPSLLAVTEIGTEVRKQYVDVFWESVPDATGYKLHCFKEQISRETLLKVFGPFDKTKITLNNIPPGKYQFKIEAIGKLGMTENSFSEPQSIDISQTEIILENINLIAIDKTTMKIEWNEVPTTENGSQSVFSKYRIYVNVDAPAKADNTDHQVIDIDDPNARYHILYDLDEKYHWFVKVIGVI